MPGKEYFGKMHENKIGNSIDLIKPLMESFYQSQNQLIEKVFDKFEASQRDLVHRLCHPDMGRSSLQASPSKPPIDLHVDLSEERHQLPETPAAAAAAATDQNQDRSIGSVSERLLAKDLDLQVAKELDLQINEECEISRMPGSFRGVTPLVGQSDNSDSSHELHLKLPSSYKEKETSDVSLTRFDKLAARHGWDGQEEIEGGLQKMEYKNQTLVRTLPAPNRGSVNPLIEEMARGLIPANGKNPLTYEKIEVVTAHAPLSGKIHAPASSHFTLETKEDELELQCKPNIQRLADEDQAIRGSSQRISSDESPTGGGRDLSFSESSLRILTEDAFNGQHGYVHTSLTRPEGATSGAPENHWPVWDNVMKPRWSLLRIPDRQQKTHRRSRRKKTIRSFGCVTII